VDIVITKDNSIVVIPKMETLDRLFNVVRIMDRITSRLVVRATHVSNLMMAMCVVGTSIVRITMGTDVREG